MRRRKLISCIVLLLLSAGCAARTAAPGPWQFAATTGIQEQVLRQGYAVAQLRLDRLEFSGPEAAQAVNKRLGELEQAKQAEFLALAQRYLDDEEFNGKIWEDRLYFTLEESLTVFYNDGLTLSVVADKQMYYAGEPHPLSYRCAYNFDALTGELLELEDIWGEDARERVAEAIYAQIEGEGKLGDYYPNLAEGLTQCFAPYDWYMDDKNIYITYDPYEIAPYALGIQEFKLPRQAVKKSP